MKRALRIISIDGTRGSGKTSQIAMLSRYFKAAGLQCLTLKAGDDIKTGLAAIAQSESFLANDSNSIVIMDGSIARPMVADIITGMPTPAVMDKYKELTHAYEKINHTYGVACFLIVMDDVQECNRRILKFKELTGSTNQAIDDTATEADIVSGMRFFDNHVISKNIKFHVINVYPKNSILEINKSIMDRLSDRYDFPKTKKDSNDW